MQLFYNSSILKFNRNLVLPSEPSIKEITQILLNKVIKKINYKKNIFKEYNSKYLDEEIKKILEIINWFFIQFFKEYLLLNNDCI